MLEVRDLHAHYGKSHILHGVNLAVASGECVSLLGRNGVGRSTTIRAIMGMVDARGSIRLRGTELIGLKTFEIARHGIGYVPENRDVFPTLSVRQNLILGIKDPSGGGSSAKRGRWSIDDMFGLFPLLAEREHSRTLIYEVLPSRYGLDIRHLLQADGIELTIGQGAKPGTGGLLLGSKVLDTIAHQRDLPVGVDQRSPARHPDLLGPDDMIIKIEELREATDWQVPIFVKMGATRVFDDVRLAAKAGADVVVVDGMEGGTGASAEICQEHTGIPTLAAVCEARAALEDLGLYGQVQLVIAGGIRNGVDAAKAMALGADAVYIGTAALMALNCNKPLYVEDYHQIGAAPYHCHHCHTGRCPVGITTQDPELMKRLEIDAAAERVANLLQAMTSEIQILARACGKADVHDLEPEDLRALSLEASMICGVPLVGTNRVFGGGPGWKERH